MFKRVGFRSRRTIIETIRTPLLPVNIIMTDRDDGTLWKLSHVVDPVGPDNNGYISLTDEWNSLWRDLHVYSANDGPMLSRGSEIFRLLVRGGRLGYEPADFGQGITGLSFQRVMTRRGMQPETREVRLPTTWQRFPDTIGWAVVSVS